MPYIFLVCLSSRYLFLFVVLSALPILRPWAFRFPLCVFSASLPPPSRCYSPFFPSPFPPLPPLTGSVMSASPGSLVPGPFISVMLKR